MRFCDALARELAKLLLAVRDFPKEYDNTIDYIRPDAAKALADAGKSEWIESFGAGAIYCINPKEEVSGDIVVPIDKTKQKEQEIIKLGCEHEETHSYDQFGVSHIHFNCPSGKPIRELIKLLTE